MVRNPYDAETIITVTQLAEQLPDVLDRVERLGERFVVQERGVAIARIVATARRPAAVVAEVIAEIGDLPAVGDGFADDLEAVQAEQGPAELRDWPD